MSDLPYGPPHNRPPVPRMTSNMAAFAPPRDIRHDGDQAEPEPAEPYEPCDDCQWPELKRWADGKRQSVCDRDQRCWARARQQSVRDGV